MMDEDAERFDISMSDSPRMAKVESFEGLVDVVAHVSVGELFAWEKESGLHRQTLQKAKMRRNDERGQHSPCCTWMRETVFMSR